ncbi:MAG: transposase [Nitrososphaerales archaeon]
MEKLIKRSLLFSLDFANTGKLNFLENLWQEYQKACQYFVDVGYETKALPSYENVKTYPHQTWLSKRYLGCALEQSKKILKSIFSKIRKGKNPQKPQIKNPSLKLDNRFYKVEKGRNSFDFWLFLRDPQNQQWIAFPFKSYEYANNYFRDWKLCSDIELLKKDGKWYLKLIFEKEVKLESKKPKGIDIGYRKLIATSDGDVFGKEVRNIIEKRIEPKKQSSKRWKRAKHYLKTEINRILKIVIDGSFSPVLEKLKNLKKGKSGVWSKSVNRKFNHWLYGYVLRRIKELCEVAGVQWHMVSPGYTSRTCPECGYQDKMNRNGEYFKCLGCGYEGDADIVGARNVLLRFTREPIVPLPAKPHPVEYFSIR